MDERYPIGRFNFHDAGYEQRQGWIKDLRTTPELLRTAVAGLSTEQLDTPYREQGWTLRQVVHHVADSHLHSYIRFRWTLTEDKPVIKAYDESLWAELSDARKAPVELSLYLLDSLHARWHSLVTELDETVWQRTFIHPESGQEVSLVKHIAMYAWHGKHHTAHISSLRSRKGWL